MNENSDRHGLGNLDELFQSAREDGLTEQTMDLVVSNLNGPTMMAAVGAPLTSLQGNEVTLAMNIIDMSGSMAPYTHDLIQSYNDDYLEALAGSLAAEDILVSTILFDSGIHLFHGYLTVTDVPLLTSHDYRPGGSTALYDAVAAGLTNMVLYAQQLRQNGVMVRCLAIVYSDGEDNASRQTATSVRRAVRELLKQEIYIMAYVGFRAGGIDQPEVRRLAAAIGFPEILLSGLSHDELRRIFRMASMSAVNVSQGSAKPGGVFA